MLSILIKEKIATGALRGFQFTPQSPVISHILYADDCLLISRAGLDDCFAFKDAIRTYWGLSGQMVNLNKSSVSFCPKLHRRLARILANCLGIKAKAGKWQYLGVPVMGGRLLKRDCDELINGIMARLSSWSASYLSMAGCLTLINSLLCAMPVYLMTNCAIPVGIFNSIEKLCRSFLWGALLNRRSYICFHGNVYAHQKQRVDWVFTDSLCGGRQ